MISELRRTQGLLFNKIAQARDLASALKGSEHIRNQSLGISYSQFKQDLVETLQNLKILADDLREKMDYLEHRLEIVVTRLVELVWQNNKGLDR